MLDTEIKITPELAAEHGLTAEEYARIRKILGRDPNFTELGIFSVMWSEHCSYKSSMVHLKRLPTRGTHVVQGPGENAGVVDIGDGLVAVFKIESHNHPSFVEPFQGAATGVGGILRDIFTTGARPIAVLDSLRFGPLKKGAGVSEEEAARNRRILDGVIGGIAFYGNCFARRRQDLRRLPASSTRRASGTETAEARRTPAPPPPGSRCRAPKPTDRSSPASSRWLR